MRLLPTASLENMLRAAAALSSAPSVCHKQMIQVSASNPSCEAPESFAPRAHNSALANVAGTLALAEIANVEEEKASKLRLRMVGAAPGVGG